MNIHQKVAYWIFTGLTIGCLAVAVLATGSTKAKSQVVYKGGKIQSVKPSYNGLAVRGTCRPLLPKRYVCTWLTVKLDGYKNQRICTCFKKDSRK
jgi:hypothetical protein